MVDFCPFAYREPLDRGPDRYRSSILVRPDPTAHEVRALDPPESLGLDMLHPRQNNEAQVSRKGRND